MIKLITETKGKGEKMKRTVLLIVVVTLFSTAAQLNATPTTATQAENVVKGWLKLNSQPLETAIGQQISNIETFTDTNNQPIYYIVNLLPDGFVIVSADDMVEPIIGFVAKGSYDSSAKNPLVALVSQDMSGRISAVQNPKVVTSGNLQPEELAKQQKIFENNKTIAHNKWEKLQSSVDSADEDDSATMVTSSLSTVPDVRVSPLIQSRWNQGSECSHYCYNYYTPNHYSCGCVATAFAQLLKFHEYPTAGIGMHPYSIKVNNILWTLYTRGGDGVGGAYNWADMTLDPSCDNYTDSRWKAIGALCYDAGITVDIKYGTPSGADPCDVKIALVDRFGYSNAIHGYNNGNNIGTGLNAMINPNLDAGYPVMIGINGTSDGGHAILADGYGYNSSTLYHHLNMGWAGVADAWYNLPAVYTTNYTATSVFKCIYNVFTSGRGEIISGRVVDDFGNPVEGVLIIADGCGGTYIDTTNSKGIYALAKVGSASPYIVTATKTGYEFESQNITTETSTDDYSTSGNCWGVNFGYGLELDTVFVDISATGDNDGTSWDDAYNHLQNGLAAALDGDQIWVAEGVYKPDLGFAVTTGSRNASFQLKNNVSIYGGFPSGGCQLQDRNPAAYETILSGDLNGNDGVNFANNTENSYHVVTGSNTDSTAVLDGFVITAGNANGAYPDPSGNGGGMYNDSASPTLVNCIFRENSANIGGGMCNDSSNPRLINCILNNNFAALDDAGGMHNRGTSSPILTNCIFSKNSATDDGGGMRNGGSSCKPKLTNCTFSDNSAGDTGGGIYSWESKPTLLNCIFWGNTDSDGSSEFSQLNDGSINSPVINYSCIQGWTGVLGGDGNIGRNPSFVDAPNDNYQLKSEAGRWKPSFYTKLDPTANGFISLSDFAAFARHWGKAGESIPADLDNNKLVDLTDLKLLLDSYLSSYLAGNWVSDDITSPCIDGGDPDSNWTAELWPHGECINMGVFGGTKQASMSVSDAGNIADLNIDGFVNHKDMKRLSDKWLCQETLLTEDLSRNGLVNYTDFSIFANQWLWEGQGWEPPLLPWDGIELSLWDVFGRKFYLSDYAGMPTLLYTGACWCGGCQKESNYIDDFANEYAPKGLHIIRGVCGDNELSALDFKKHYQLPIVHLMDTNRILDTKHNTNGWPFFAIFDKTGVLVYKKIEGYVHEELETIEPIIDDLLADSPQITPVIRDGVPYPPVTIARSGENTTTLRRERFSSLACGFDGKVYVVFTSNRNGNSDVFIKVFDGTSWSADTAVAATSADEYDAQIIIDYQNRVWVSWTSNSNSDHYNIFTTTFTSLTDPMTATQVTQAYDGAMHSRMARDIAGRIWITYYKWDFFEGNSRDKEVYLRRWDNIQWSNEILLSPTDVPEYEDHSDPTIAAFASGVAVFWSWDFHQPDGYLQNYTKTASYPTIFGRTIDSTMSLGSVTDISGDSGGQAIDLTPAIAVGTNNHIWCVWDSKDNGNSYLKTVRVKNVATDTIYDVTPPMVNVCSPCVAISPNGTVTVIWSQTLDGNNWILKRSVYNSSTNSFSSPQTIYSENNPRYPSAAYDSTGQLCISYSIKTPLGREIIVITP